MRRVEAKPLLEYILSGRVQTAGLERGPSFLVARHLFSSSVLFSSFFAILVVSSFFDRASMIGAFALGCYAVAVFFRTRTVANGLQVKRKIQRHSFTELDEVEVVIELINASAFAIPAGLLIEDHFELAQESLVLLAVDREIPAYSRVYVSYKRKCDGGMGDFHIGPMLVRVTDPQALIEFRVSEDDLLLCHVFPKILTLPEVRLSGTPASRSYGTFEVANRGSSVNFSGVRPYVEGDSLRHIAWKVSAKRQAGLMVKEFERNVSCDVTILLNLDPRLHVGFKSHSTWEAAKDLALGIASQQIENGNTVQVLLNDVLIEPSRGEEHLERICRQLMDLKPHEGEITREFVCLPRKFEALIAPGSTVFYIVPFDLVEFRDSFATLRAWQEQGMRVFCLYIDAYAFLSRLNSSPANFAVSEFKSFESLKDSAHHLELAGITVHVIRSPEDLNKVFLKGTRLRGRRETSA